MMPPSGERERVAELVRHRIEALANARERLADAINLLQGFPASTIAASIRENLHSEFRRLEIEIAQYRLAI